MLLICCFFREKFSIHYKIIIIFEQISENLSSAEDDEIITIYERKMSESVNNNDLSVGGSLRNSSATEGSYSSNSETESPRVVKSSSKREVVSDLKMSKKKKTNKSSKIKKVS